MSDTGSRNDLANDLEAHVDDFWLEDSPEPDWQRVADRVFKAGWRPSESAARRTASVVLFKPSGIYYTTESWRVPDDALGPYDMTRSPDFRRISGIGPVLVCSDGELIGDENWGYPHLFEGIEES